jgi:hypothetical protein
MARTEEQPEVIQLGEFLRAFHKESDRGAALSAASLLDDRLTEIIEAFFADVPQTKELIAGFNAPLGTFSSRIAAAYGLGLLQENEHKELHSSGAFVMSSGIAGGEFPSRRNLYRNCAHNCLGEGHRKLSPRRPQGFASISRW